MKTTSKILVVGGTGFLGYHLSKKCLKLGWKVTSLSTKKPKKKRFLKNVKYIFCDISKNNSLKKIPKKNFQFIVNFGGYVDHSNAKKTFNSHFIGAVNLSNFFLKKRYDHLSKLEVEENMGIKNLLIQKTTYQKKFLSLIITRQNFWLQIIF